MVSKMQGDSKLSKATMGVKLMVYETFVDSGADLVADANVHEMAKNFQRVRQDRCEW